MMVCGQRALSSCGACSTRQLQPLARLPAVQQRSRGRCLTIVNMKKDIHPKYYEEAKVICNGEEVLTVSGTKERYVVDVWSGNHPFFKGSGEQLILDEGRVNKFNKRFASIGSFGQVAPASTGGDKKLEYKAAGKQDKKGKGGKKK
ncbi:g11572 [Coccomyxa viridis]|uniref:50S ribosomal protein L31 n=1 Tax=Coccomyxa viridis TaxID=1274662 RepID=A0ABP1GCM5_9CHLO